MRVSRMTVYRMIKTGEMPRSAWARATASARKTFTTT